jgi:hypothetical protein
VRYVTHISCPISSDLYSKQCAAGTTLHSLRDGFTANATEQGLYSFSLDAVEEFLIKNNLSSVVMRGEQTQAAPNVVTLATAAGDESEILILEKSQFSPLDFADISKRVLKLISEGSNVPSVGTRMVFSFQRISNDGLTGNQALHSGHEHVATGNGRIEDEMENGEAAGSSASGT